MLRTIRYRGLWLFLLIFTILVLPVQRSARSAEPDQLRFVPLQGEYPHPVELGEVWQSSQEPAVQLGVRNKFGNRRKYTAVWIVSGEDGRRYGARATVEGDDWGYVFFPENFGAISRPIGYTWTVSVDGKRVAAGSFEFKSVQGYSDQLEVP